MVRGLGYLALRLLVLNRNAVATGNKVNKTEIVITRLLRGSHR